MKVPILGLGMVDYDEHKEECHSRRCSYDQRQQQNLDDASITVSFFKLYTRGPARKYFWENPEIKVFVESAQPHHRHASANAKAFEFQAKDGKRRHFCLEAGSCKCRVTKASNLSLFP